MHETLRRLILLSAGLFCLAACQSKPIEQMSYTESKALFAELHKRCAAQGAPIGSPENDACIKQELGREASIRQENANRRNSIVVCNRSFNTVICN